MRKSGFPATVFSSCLALLSVSCSSPSAHRNNSVPNAPSVTAGTATPLHNVAIVVDSTTAMNVVDKECKTSGIGCALAGVRTLLGELEPCREKNSRCVGKNTNIANAGDMVSLFTFPNVTVDTAIHDYDCSRAHPTVEAYTFPPPGASSYEPLAPVNQPGRIATYQIVKYTNNYRISDKSKTLNPASDLVKAAGGVARCKPMVAIGGEGTYIAGAIYAAQASLVAEQASRPGSINALILITDGEVNSAVSQLGREATNLGSYPSFIHECSQAVTAAKAATATGTMMYAVAYGAESAGCRTEVSGDYKGMTPCQTMQAIASSPALFYSDFSFTFNSAPCVSAAHPNPNMNAIFDEIARSIAPSLPASKKRPKRAQ